MKKLGKILLKIFLILLVAGGYYLFKLRTLALEGNRLFELRCTQVNPPLISYKNAFLGFSDGLNNPGSYTPDEIRGFFDTYISKMREYVPTETTWLLTNQAYITRWDFQLLMPWYIKQYADLQMKKYEGYRDDAKYMLEMYDSGDDSGAADTATANHQAARARRDEAEDNFLDFFETIQSLPDWRKPILNMPIPEGCTPENTFIPNTSGSIDWENGSTTPSPPLAPLIPNARS